MDTLYQEYPFLFLLAAVYLSLAVAKVILCLASAKVAALALREVHPEIGPGEALVTVVVAVVVLMPFYVIPALIDDGLSFFLVYDDDLVRHRVMDTATVS